MQEAAPLLQQREREAVPDYESFRRSSAASVAQSIEHANASILTRAAEVAYPWGLTVAVVVDAMVDGLLIGISSASGSSSNAGR
jgi:hypothetical protein